MNSARSNILSKLRVATHVSIEFQREPIRFHDIDKQTRIKQFTERMEAVRAEVHQITRKNWLIKLTEICADKKLGNLLLAPETEWGEHILQSGHEKLPQLLHYDQQIEDWKQVLFDNVDASLTTTLGGISETGTLILWPTPSEPRTMSLVPPIHIAILETRNLYTTFSEAIDKQQWASQMPSNALLISGPSKSADIEQTLAYGVHGPKELIVLLLTD